MTSPLLINESPLQVLPSLAVKIGLNEAIVLQQIHYWLSPKFRTPEKFFNGRYWTHNTIAQWMVQFPFWAEKTVRRTMKALQSRGLILTYTKKGFQKVVFYTIDYDVLSTFHQLSDSPETVKNRPVPSGHIDQSDLVNFIDSNSEKIKKTLIKENITDIASRFASGVQSVVRRGQNDQIDKAKMGTSLTKNTPSEITKKNTFLSCENFEDPSWDFAQKMCVIFSEVVLDGRVLALHAQRARALEKAFFGPLGCDLSTWRAVCNNVTRSYFLMGEEQSSHFRASLDWVLVEKNLIRIMEGSAYGIGARTGHMDSQIKTLHEEKRASQLADEKLRKAQEISMIISSIEDQQWATVCEHFIKNQGLDEFQATLKNVYYVQCGGEDFLVSPDKSTQRNLRTTVNLRSSLWAGYPALNIYTLKFITADEVSGNSELLQAFERVAQKRFGFDPLPKPASKGCEACSAKEVCSCLETNENAPLYLNKHTPLSERTTTHATQ